MKMETVNLYLYNQNLKIKIMKVVSNDKDNSFILIKDDGTKYAILGMTDDEFEEAQYNTEEDWKNFLRTDQNYFEV